MAGRVAMVSGTAWYLWNFRRNVIRAFTDRGWRVDAIAGSDDWSEQLGELSGVTLHDWPVSMDGSNPLQELAALRRIVAVLRRTKPDIVFNNGIKANVYGGMAGRWLRIPYVNNVSGLGMRMRAGDRKARLLARLYCYGSARAKALLIQNLGDLAFLHDHGLPKVVPTIRTMGSGVDLNHFAKAQMPPAPPIRLVFVGRLQEDKGIGDLMKAAELLSAQDIDITVIGDATHANTGAISAQGLADWKSQGLATFAGHQADVRPFLADSHALIMPSHGGEGMPKVILEAAAMGRPAIVSDIDGCRDSIVPDKTGLLTAARDPEGLAETIKTFAALSDEKRIEMSEAARKHAEDNFSDQAINAICLELAEQVGPKP